MEGRSCCFTACGIIVSLFGLTIMFTMSPNNFPAVSRFETTTHFKNSSCSTYITAPDAASWDCLTCLRASSGRGFCSNEGDMLKPGACLIDDPSGRQACLGGHRKWVSYFCPRQSNSIYADILLAGYIMSYAIGLGIVPWIVNSEIYPTKIRGICGGMAAVVYWLSFLFVSVWFFSFTKAQGPSNTTLLVGLVSCLVLGYVKLFVPETKGLLSEEVENTPVYTELSKSEEAEEV